ncbi:MAG TPA: hypothetical protein VF525_02050 [Pyrinomonadaceae bacterium]|jgi:hypothetical protein
MPKNASSSGATTTTVTRTAALQLEQQVGRQTLRVRVPRDVSDKDFGLIGKSIIDVIRSHTGCNCLSGAIDVVFQDELRDAIRVDLR